MNIFLPNIREYLGKKSVKMIDINQIDIVVPVPDTSKPVALEISKQINLIMKQLL